MRDLFTEALAALLSRPHRALMTAAGTVLGVGALVATLGLAGTAGNRIVTRFDELAATHVVVLPTGAEGEAADPAVNTLPWDAEPRLTRLNGVTAAATLSSVDVGGAQTRAVPVTDPLGRRAEEIPVRSSSPGLPGAVRGTLAAGRWFDAGHNERGDRVAVLGRGAATTLNIFDVSRRPAVFVGERAYTVVGILDDVKREESLLGSLILPDGTARADFGLAAPESVQIDTRVGAARLIASQADLALAPQAPDSLRVLPAPEPAATRAKVAGDIQALFLLLGVVSLVIGGLGIANTSLVSVMERTSEIGLRRALGASRRQVAGQFLVESALTGLFGGLLGASAGVLVIVGVAVVQQWTPVLDARLVVLAPVIGAVVGLLAGGYPAARAARTEPVAALRSEL